MPANREHHLLNLSTPAALRELFASLGFAPQHDIFFSADTLEWPANVAADLGGRRLDRNAIAHTEAVPRKQAERIHTAVLGRADQPGLLLRLVRMLRRPR